MYLLSKLLPLFVLPFGISVLLLVWGVTRRRPGLVVAALVILLVASNPILSRWLIRSTEGWAERRPVADVVPADAVVVLSQGRIVAPGPEGVSEWNDADRFHAGVRLAEAQKAPWLVFTGAWSSWEPDAPREGDVLKAEAQRLGIPAHVILVTGPVLNTVDEAREVRLLLAPRIARRPRVVLVTSAFHMPRAREVFEQSGVSVDPFPVDFAYSQGRQFTVLDVVPSVVALAGTQTALREQYGRAYSRLRAWWRGPATPEAAAEPLR